MTLREFLETLEENKGFSITLANAEGDVLITFQAEGWQSVESDILDKEVKKVLISNSKMTIRLKEA